MFVTLVGDHTTNTPVGIDSHLARGTVQYHHRLVVDALDSNAGLVVDHAEQGGVVLDVFLRERLAHEAAFEQAVNAVAVGAEVVHPVERLVERLEMFNDRGVVGQDGRDLRCTAGECAGEGDHQQRGRATRATHGRGLRDARPLSACRPAREVGWRAQRLVADSRIRDLF